MDFPVELLYWLCGAWFVVNLATVPWLRSEASGERVVRRYKFIDRLLLFVDPSSSWEKRFSPADLPAARVQRHRLHVWYFGIFVAPMVVLWWLLWVKFF